jgi:N-acetylglucosaminyldiphosphoundecaprenol N-acetyl-beta-D-mannosaminyltransferase
MVSDGMPELQPIPRAASSAQRLRILGVPVDRVDPDQALDRLLGLVESRRQAPASPAGLVVTLNPEMVMHARRDPHFRSLVEGAALIIPDGIGVVRGMRRRGAPGAVRVSGEAARRGHRVLLLGAEPGVAQAAAAVYRSRHPRLQVSADSGDPTPETALRVAQLHPEMILAAYGHGRQEAFLASTFAITGAAAGVGVGGTFDYVSGRRRRAPAVVQHAGMEWAWRLAAEPRRLRRQTALPRFWWQERREIERGAGGR